MIAGRAAGATGSGRRGTERGSRGALGLSRRLPPGSEPLSGVVVRRGADFRPQAIDRRGAGGVVEAAPLQVAAELLAEGGRGEAGEPTQPHAAGAVGRLALVGAARYDARHHLGLHAAGTQLGAQRGRAAGAEGLALLHPVAGESVVVDEAPVVEARSCGGDRVGRVAALAEAGLDLLGAARPIGEE